MPITFAAMTSSLLLRRLAAGVLLTATLAACTTAWHLRPHQQPKLLVVHSYSTDLPWVGDVDFGIDAELRRSGIGVQVRRHYMNLLNHPDCTHLREAARDVQQAIDDWQPQVLVLVDDLAQAAVGVRHLRVQPGTTLSEHDVVEHLTAGRCTKQPLAPPGVAASAVFYAGVNGEIANYGYDRASNVTGVLEYKNLAAIAKVLEQINAAARPSAVAVQLLNDKSATAMAEGRRYGTVNGARLRWLEPVNVASFAEWKHQVQAASQRGAMLLIANYQNLSDELGRSVPAEEVIAWTERHSIYPAVGAGTAFVADGGLVTVAISGVEQGEIVTHMALHYLRTGELLPQQSARRILIGLHRALARKHQLQPLPLYRTLQTELGHVMAVSEQVYLETEIKGERP